MSAELAKEIVHGEVAMEDLVVDILKAVTKHFEKHLGRDYRSGKVEIDPPTVLNACSMVVAAMMETCPTDIRGTVLHKFIGDVDRWMSAAQRADND